MPSLYDSLRVQNLETVTVGIVKVNAVGITGSALYLHPMVLQLRLDRLVGPFMDHQGHVIQVMARDERFPLLLLENGHALAAAVHKTLPGTLVIHRHTQQV
jgi:hypothetical protein